MKIFLVPVCSVFVSGFAKLTRDGEREVGRVIRDIGLRVTGQTIGIMACTGKYTEPTVTAIAKAFGVAEDDIEYQNLLQPTRSGGSIESAIAYVIRCVKFDRYECLIIVVEEEVANLLSAPIMNVTWGDTDRMPAIRPGQNMFFDPGESFPQMS